MHYRFPCDLHIDEVYEAIEQHNQRIDVKAFIAAERGDHVIFNYIVSCDGSFPFPEEPSTYRQHAILRECRGLIMCPSSGRVLRRTYHKWFNCGERQETLPGNVDISRSHVILEKLDGSLLSPWRRANGDLTWGTRMGDTDVARLAIDFLAAHPQYHRMAEHCVNNGLTPLFEWCSLRQRIILAYSDDQLILTGIRDNRTGHYTSYHDLVAIGRHWNVPVVGALGEAVSDIQQFLDRVRDLEGIEGYVIRFDDGHMLKVKGEWYCHLHRTKDLLQWEKDVWALVLDDRLDDAKAFMSDDDQARATAFATAFHRAVDGLVGRLAAIVDKARAAHSGEKKRFAIEIVNRPDIGRERAMLFQIWDGRDPRRVVLDFLRQNVGTSTKIDDVRPLLGGLRWDHYYTIAGADSDTIQ